MSVSSDRVQPSAVCELAVVGGGLVGTTLAIACAGAGLDVVLLDREKPEHLIEETFDGRASAIAFGSQEALAAIGLWAKLAAQAEPILEIRVADGDSPLFLHYDHRDVGDHALGFMVENRALRRALLNRAAELPGLRHWTPRTVATVACNRSGATLELADGTTLRAELVAAADGKTSPLRRAAGIGAVEWSYPQTGIVTTVEHELPHRGVAVEHFLPAGPFAILPLSGNRSSIVWTERADLAPRLMALADADFARELANRFGDFLGVPRPVGPRWSYPLAFLHAERYVAERLALVGDAAHVIHPIAGQGLNLGLRDVMALAECLIDARRLGFDLGDPRALERYERWRRLDNWMLSAVTDSLNRLFSNALPVVKSGRDLGLAAVNRVAPLKRLLMRHAMGLVGDLPRLARGEPL
ncbi:MAG TPA: UbiH/UbiF/VisC/COQ6 family ubiquinone biosynthesis hydroxylase [Stellaceae bacterium]|nr:UbiH/UbiF/VisC/COQ6 family ubiquinone biosynthesis hydroxylase [Stellaceae bacterium]